MPKKYNPTFTEYCRATNFTEDYSTGDLVMTAQPQFPFWAEVYDGSGDTKVIDEKRLDTAELVLLTRSRDVANVTNGTEIVVDGDTIIYTVSDKYQPKGAYKFLSFLILYAIEN